MPARTHAWLLVCVPLFTGCAQNAIFELHVRLPTSTQVPATARFVRAQVRSRSAPFETVYESGSSPAVAIPTTPTERGLLVSVVGSGAGLQEGLHAKVQLCRDDACTDVVLERWYDFPRVFYRGAFTCYDVPFPTHAADPTLDEEVTLVDRCDIAGCRSGNTGDNNCTGGTHECESPEALPTSTYCDILQARDTR